MFLTLFPMTNFFLKLRIIDFCYVFSNEIDQTIVVHQCTCDKRDSGFTRSVSLINLKIIILCLT